MVILIIPNGLKVIVICSHWYLKKKTILGFQVVRQNSTLNVKNISINEWMIQLAISAPFVRIKASLMSDLRACCDVTWQWGRALCSQIMKVSVRRKKGFLCVNPQQTVLNKNLFFFTYSWYSLLNFESLGSPTRREKKMNGQCDDVEQNCVSHKQKQMF